MPLFEDLFNLDEDQLLPLSDTSLPLMINETDSIAFQNLVEKINNAPVEVCQSGHSSKDAFLSGLCMKSNNSSLMDSSLDLSFFDIDESQLEADQELLEATYQMGDAAFQNYDNFSSGSSGNVPEVESLVSSSSSNKSNSTSGNTTELESLVSSSSSSNSSSGNTSEAESLVSSSSNRSLSSSKLILKLTPEAKAFLQNNSLAKQQPVVDQSNKKSSAQKTSLKRKDLDSKSPAPKRGRPAKSKAPRQPQQSVIPTFQPEVPQVSNHDDDDDNEVYCICRQRNDPSKPMVQCETCEDWFHFTCVNYRSSPVFYCPDCSKTQKRRGKKRSSKK